MARILSISYDHSLSRTRELILQDCGHEVVSGLGLKASLMLCDGNYDLVIIGHSIPRSERLTMVQRIRARSHDVPVLILLRAHEEPITGDRVHQLRADDGPEALVTTIAGILTDVESDTEAVG